MVFFLTLQGRWIKKLLVKEMFYQRYLNIQHNLNSNKKKLKHEKHIIKTKLKNIYLQY